MPRNRPPGCSTTAAAGAEGDPANAGIRSEPELPEHEEIVAPPPSPAQEFDILDDEPDVDAASRAIIDLVAARGGVAHIPTQSRVKVQRSVAPMLYRRRNLVERYFCKLKQFRRIATRFDKRARNFLAAVALASTRIWLRAIEPTP